MLVGQDQDFFYISSVSNPAPFAQHGLQFCLCEIIGIPF